MPTRIGIVNGIVITVAIEVKSIYGFRIKKRRIIGGYKPSPLGGVVTCVEEIEACFLIEVIASISEGVSVCYSGVCCAEDCTLTVSIVSIFSNLISIRIVNADNVAKKNVFLS